MLLDLLIALALVLLWLVHATRATGHHPWPWVAATAVAGSFGPMVNVPTRPQAPR